MLIGLASFSSLTTAQQGKPPFKEGTHYLRLPFLISPQQRDTIEIALFFSYGAPASQALEPAIRGWLSEAHPKTAFRRFPVTAGDPLWLLYAKIYYAARTLGLLNKTHEALFAAIQDGSLNTAEQAAVFYAEYGITEARFLETIATTEVHNDLVAARAAVAVYQVRSLPALVVGGRHRLITDSFETQEELLACLDFLVRQELQRYRLAGN